MLLLVVVAVDGVAGLGLVVVTNDVMEVCPLADVDAAAAVIVDRLFLFVVLESVIVDDSKSSSLLESITLF